MTGLDGRVALVTGAGKRLGAAIALRLAQAGADVVVHHHSSEEGAKETAAAVTDAGRRAWSLQADLGDPDVAGAFVGRAADAAGARLDLLVNNASIFPPGTMATMEWERLDQNMRVNAWAPFALTRAFAAQAASDADANVVNLIDARANDHDWQHVPYILSKKTLWAMTEMAALEYAPRVRVNGVAPGPVLPGPGASEEAFQDLARFVPLRRVGDPDRVADAVLYLATAAYTTGQVLHVDGGRHLGRTVHGE